MPKQKVEVEVDVPIGYEATGKFNGDLIFIGQPGQDCIVGSMILRPKRGVKMPKPRIFKGKWSWRATLDLPEHTVGGPWLSDKTADSCVLNLADGRRFRVRLVWPDDYEVTELKGEEA